MTEKPLNGIEFPDLPDTYMVVPLGMFTREINVNKNNGTATFWQLIEDVYSEMADHTIEYCLGRVPYPYYPDDPNEPEGGVWVVEIYRATGDYGCVSAYLYQATQRGNIKRFERSKYEGYWRDICYPNGIESVAHKGCFYHIVNGEVEWINPPMVAGVEYRTTERRNGMPVYVKRESFSGALAGGSTSDGSYRTLLKATTIPYPSSVYESTIRIQTDVGRQNATGICVLLQSDNSVRFIHAQLDATEAIKNTSEHPYYDLVVTYPNGYNQLTYIDWTVKYTK